MPPSRYSRNILPKHLPPNQSKRGKPLNGYITFYCKFYKQILDKEYPNLTSQEKAIKAGEKWRFLPVDLKNSFIEFANNERLLKNGLSRPQTLQRLMENPQSKSELRVIFDDRCHKDVRLDQISNENNLGTTLDEYERIFDEYIDKDAYI
jgi:hypothetical protein